MHTTLNINLKETIQKIEGAYAPATIRAYKADFENFIEYCSYHNLSFNPTDPLSVANYIDNLSKTGISSAYIRRIIASISTINKFNYLSDPTNHPEVKLAMRKMHRKLGRFAHQASGINKKLLEELINSTGDSLIDKRDRVLVLIAYETLCRRSELISLRTEDVKSNPNQNSILLRKSKTDQDAQGKWLHISSSTYQHLINWLDETGIESGYIFRGVKKGNKLTNQLTAGQVSRIIKKLCLKADLDHDQVKDISGHSLRIGAAQDLMISGASLPVIMARGRWSKTDTVMRYIENANYQI